MLSAVQGKPITLAVPPDAPLPMIHRDDLVHGLMLLMDAPKHALKEPHGGYVDKRNGINLCIVVFACPWICCWHTLSKDVDVNNVCWFGLNGQVVTLR